MVLYFLLSFIICLTGYAELLVYNEEVLLALCFVLFIYFAYSVFSSSISNDFDIQTNKLIADLLQALDNQMHTEMSTYNYSKDIMQFNHQVELLHILLLNDLILIPQETSLLLTEQTSYIFLHEIIDKAKTMKTREKTIQGAIIERYIFSSLFDMASSAHSVDTNIKSTALCGNLISYTEIHCMD